MTEAMTVSLCNVLSLAFVWLCTGTPHRRAHHLLRGETVNCSFLLLLSLAPS